MTLIVLLFSLGLVFLVLEVMIPGGILGIAGGILLFIGCILSFVRLGTGEGLIAISIALAAAAIVFFIQFKILPNTTYGRKFFLKHQISGSSANLTPNAQDLIGKTAIAVTVLSPTGYVTVSGKRYEAQSQSGQIPPNTELEVTAANSFQLSVRLKS